MADNVFDLQSELDHIDRLLSPDREKPPLFIDDKGYFEHLERDETNRIVSLWETALCDRMGYRRWKNYYDRHRERLLHSTMDVGWMDFYLQNFWRRRTLREKLEALLIQRD